jgi:hypothetical protein
MNLYAYVGNDPLNATDPTGEQSVTIAGEYKRGIGARRRPAAGGGYGTTRQAPGVRFEGGLNLGRSTEHGIDISGTVSEAGGWIVGESLNAEASVCLTCTTESLAGSGALTIFDADVINIDGATVGVGLERIPEGGAIPFALQVSVGGGAAVEVSSVETSQELFDIQDIGGAIIGSAMAAVPDIQFSGQATRERDPVMITRDQCVNAGRCRPE